jgi:hypothetical protein
LLRSPRSGPSLARELRGRYRIADGVAGVIFAGLLMTVFAMAAYGALRLGSIWAPVYLYAAAVHGPWGDLEGLHPWPLAVGLGLHLAWSVALGALFGTVARGRPATLLAVAVLLGVASWAVAEIVTLPLLNPVMARWFQPAVLLAAHVVFGLALGTYLIVRGPAGARERSEVGPRERATA